MDIKNVKTAITHWRDFHADDVFAAAILKLTFPKIKILRKEYNDTKSQAKADIRFDVGMKYDAKTGDFDHHQPNFNSKRENGILYSSVGLVWKEFGMKIVKNNEIFEQIDKRLIQTIDAIDSGYTTFSLENIIPYTIQQVIVGINPIGNNKTMENFDKMFEEAVDLAIKILKREISNEKSKSDASKILKNIVDKSKGEYLILEKSMPWKDYIVKNTNFKLVIEYDEATKNWDIYAVPLRVGNYERRIDLPKEWGGLRNEELERVSGVKGAIFCHKELFFAVAKTKDAAIKMVEIVLGEK